MKNKLYILILVLISLLLVNKIYGQEQNLCIIDTSQNNVYVYQPVIKILEKVGFKCSYLPVAKVLDKNKNLDLKKYSTIFFLINSEFLTSLKNNNFVTTTILNLINNCASQPNKLIAFFISQNSNDIFDLKPLLETIGLHVSSEPTTFNGNFKNNKFTKEKFINFMENQSIFSDNFSTISSPLIISKLNTCIDKNLTFKTIQNDPEIFLRFEDNVYLNRNNENFLNNLLDLETFKNSLQLFISEPLEKRFRDYHTSISKPRYNQNNYFYQNDLRDQITITAMPVNQASYQTSLAPYGIYWYNPQNKNHIFIGSKSTLNFAGINENFHILPSCKQKKEILLQEVSQLLTELHHIAIQTKNNNLQGVNFHNVPSAPNIEVIKNNINNGNGTKIAWMEIDIFKNEKEIKKQNLLIDYIYKAGLKYLWISLAPNMYFSPIGTKQKEIDTFLATISRFTKKLKDHKHNNNYPQILIGFEIANNLYGENLPKSFATDIYGNDYTDIPTPLDDKFWENEIIIPVQKLSQHWKAISNGIPIRGFVIDLEMYMRKYCGTFLSTMSFDEETFHKYSSPKFYNISIQEYLIKHKLLEDYYSFLHTKAISLGKKLKNEFQKACPNCTIACYAPNISIDWFYLGLYKGLSEKQHPLTLLTFNTEFYAHKNWLEKNNIYAKHFNALMLSKIGSDKDFHLSDGDVWINRFSRFIDEKIPGAWYTNEQPNIKEKDVLDFLNYLNTH